MPVKACWIPPRSPYSLIQEDLFPNEWLILVSCVMLNCTSRKQVERVLPSFIERWPGPVEFMDADISDVTEVIRSLGFGNRRATNIRKMTQRYLAGPWEHARELPGIGAYGAAAWEIFCAGIITDEPPKDHALTLYHAWLRQRVQPVVDAIGCDP